MYIGASGLCLPTSNAVVERIFSIMNSTKTKLRNRMSVNLLNSILRIKVRLYSQNKCCQDFNVTDSMLKNFTSSVLYPFSYESAPTATLQESMDDLEVFDILSSEFNRPCISIPE